MNWTEEQIDAKISYHREEAENLAERMRQLGVRKKFHDDKADNWEEFKRGPEAPEAPEAPKRKRKKVKSVPTDRDGNPKFKMRSAEDPENPDHQKFAHGQLCLAIIWHMSDGDRHTSKEMKEFFEKEFNAWHTQASIGAFFSKDHNKPLYIDEGGGFHRLKK